MFNSDFKKIPENYGKFVGSMRNSIKSVDKVIQE